MRNDYRICARSVLGIILFASCFASIADTLVIPNISTQPINAPTGVLRPVRSMTMEQVKMKFGQPRNIISAIGNPPITRWVYDEFVVHFEHTYVIHSVVTK